MEVEKVDHIVNRADLTKPAVSSEFGAQVAEVTGKLRKAVYPVWLFQNLYSQTLVNESRLTHGELLLERVQLILVIPHKMSEAVAKTLTLIMMSLLLTVWRMQSHFLNGW